MEGAYSGVCLHFFLFVVDGYEWVVWTHAELALIEDCADKRAEFLDVLLSRLEISTSWCTRTPR